MRLGGRPRLFSLRLRRLASRPLARCSSRCFSYHSLCSSGLRLRRSAAASRCFARISAAFASLCRCEYSRAARRARSGCLSRYRRRYSRTFSGCSSRYLRSRSLSAFTFNARRSRPRAFFSRRFRCRSRCRRADSRLSSRERSRWRSRQLRLDAAICSACSWRYRRRLSAASDSARVLRALVSGLCGAPWPSVGHTRSLRLVGGRDGAVHE